MGRPAPPRHLQRPVRWLHLIDPSGWRRPVSEQFVVARRWWWRYVVSHEIHGPTLPTLSSESVTSAALLLHPRDH
jgi:hypothetical protein